MWHKFGATKGPVAVSRPRWFQVALYPYKLWAWLTSTGCIKPWKLLLR